MSTDLVQRWREALTEVIDTAPDVVAVTGRDPAVRAADATPNIVPWSTADDLDGLSVPVIAFQVGNSPRIGGTGQRIRSSVTLTAIAENDSQAHELLGAAERACTCSAFLSAANLDVYAETLARRGGAEPARADTDCVFVVGVPLAA